MAEKSRNKLFTLVQAGESFGLDMVKFEDCARWIIARLHPDGASCPHCSAAICGDSRLEKWYLFEQLRCPECRTKFTAATGTHINGSKLEIREIYLVAVLSHLGVPSPKIASTLRVHVDTVTNWLSKFRAHQELAGA
jgi:transposase-like protein